MVFVIGGKPSNICIKLAKRKPHFNMRFGIKVVFRVLFGKT